MSAAKDKPGTAATKAHVNLDQEQKKMQPSFVAACHKLKAPEAAAKAAPESDEDEEDGSTR